jgi:hypothetical protein
MTQQTKQNKNKTKNGAARVQAEWKRHVIYEQHISNKGPDHVVVRSVYHFAVKWPFTIDTRLFHTIPNTTGKRQT